MSEYDGEIVFKAWLPDQPELNSPGLTEARNVLPLDGTYASYAPSNPYGAAAGHKVLTAKRVLGANITGLTGFIYAGAIGTTAASTAGHIYALDDQFQTANALSATSWADVAPSGYAASTAMSIALYKEFVIVTNGVSSPVYRTFSSAATMGPLGSSVGTAPAAKCIGVVGQFVVLGNIFPTLSAENVVQWSGIDAPLNWPTPNSATAIAQQSGVQYLDALMGGVVGITEGDRWGLILQDGGIVRMTYVGGSTVFDFAIIHRGPGPIGQYAWVQMGSQVFFVSAAGFFVCDGVQVVAIGDGIIDRYFLSRLDTARLLSVSCGIDYTRSLVFWTLPKSTDAVAGDPEELVVFNYAEKRWSHVYDTVRTFISSGEARSAERPLEGISHTNRRAHFNGTPGTAILATAEMEPNPGGLASYQGVKPLVDVTVNAVTIAMGTRNNRTDAVTYTSERTANSRSGFANFRDEARYHRARVTITGTFNAAQGLEYQAEASGYT